MPGDFHDTMLVLPLGSRERVAEDYRRWCAEVSQVSWFSQRKLKKLWKLGFSAKDIENNKHHVLFPPEKPRAHESLQVSFKRGPALSQKKIEEKLLEAMRRELAKIQTLHRLEPATLQWARQFDAELSKRLQARKNAGTVVQRVRVYTTGIEQYREALIAWYRQFLLGGRLVGAVPGTLQINTTTLFYRAREIEPRLRHVHVITFGKFLRLQGLGKLHTALGNLWEFDALGKCRVKFDACYGAVDWSSGPSEWRFD